MHYVFLHLQSLIAGCKHISRVIASYAWEPIYLRCHAASRASNLASLHFCRGETCRECFSLDSSLNCAVREVLFLFSLCGYTSIFFIFLCAVHQRASASSSLPWPSIKLFTQRGLERMRDRRRKMSIRVWTQGSEQQLVSAEAQGRPLLEGNWNCSFSSAKVQPWVFYFAPICLPCRWARLSAVLAKYLMGLWRDFNKTHHEVINKCIIKPRRPQTSDLRNKPKKVLTQFYRYWVVFIAVPLI